MKAESICIFLFFPFWKGLPWQQQYCFLKSFLIMPVTRDSKNRVKLPHPTEEKI